jgi:choline-sulfatase
MLIPEACSSNMGGNVTNILMLMSDEHNARVASVYGHSRVETPNMERLADEGVIYDAAYCPSPLCAPCRSSVMSGLPVHQTQVYNNCCVFQFEYPTYGAVLASQGVHSVYAGKTDVYNHSGTLGFTEMLSPGDRKSPGDINFLRVPLSIREDGVTRADSFGIREGAFDSDTAIVDSSLAWLSNTAPMLDTPWTLTVNITAPHFPHWVTAELWEKYRDAGDLPSYGNDVESANHPYAQDLRSHFQTDGFSEEQIRGLRRGYLGRVEYVDTQLGRLLDALETTGLRDDTIVIYTSDHGEMLGKFGMWWKSSMYDDSLRVPLIVSGPGFNPGTSVSTPVSLLDVQATMFRATGTTRPEGWWGTPLQDIGPDDTERVVFAEYHGHGTRSGSFMIRKGHWKLLYHAAAPHQLFNITVDLEELVNQYDHQQAIAKTLESELRRLCDPEAEIQRALDFENAQHAHIRQITA